MTKAADQTRRVVDIPTGAASSDGPPVNDNCAAGSLRGAYDNQLNAAQKHKQITGCLQTEVGNLEKSLEAYLRVLERIDVSRLHRKARRLAMIADGWSAVTR